MNDKEFYNFLTNTVPNNFNIHKYLIVTRNKLREHKRIVCSYSGGSDSDIMADLIELVKPPDDCGEIRYIFFDTGLEFDATIRHVAEVEQKYGITVERIRPKKAIPVACKEYGIPFISKDLSEVLCRLQNHGFNWAENFADAQYFGRCKSAIDYFYNTRPPSASGKSKFSIIKFKLLKEFLTTNPPTFAISEKCCNFAKKNVSKDFDRTYNPDLKIIGMRQAEGGRRVGAVKNCFTPANDNSVANYRPLWFWTDEDKRIYKEWRGIRYSDCYETWGFSRTGCVGCPCSSKVLQDLQIAEQYEPNKVKAAYAVFGESYAYREAYNQFKKSGGIT